MSMQESAIGAPDVSSSAPIAGGSMPEGSSPSSSGSGAPSEQSLATSSAPVQGTTDQTQTPTDPLAGLPTLEELRTQVEQNVPGAKGMAQLRGVYEEIRPKVTELETKLKPFENFVDRFQTPEEVQQAVEWHDKLFGAYERNDRGQLVPATEVVAQELAQRDPLVADYLASDLMNGMTRSDDGREISRFDLALEVIRNNPERRTAALKLLGGVEPNSIAPTWQATDEQLALINDPIYPTKENEDLAEIFKRLPYDEREKLAATGDPEFIKSQLKKEQVLQNITRENEIAKQREAQTQQRREQYFREQSENAGNQAVEQGFKQLFAEYRDTVVDNSKFIALLDPNSPEAQQMGPEAVAQFNQSAQRVNTGVGKFIALATAALAVPDTSWIAQDVLKELGVPDELIEKFNASRMEYANNTRDAGQLSFEAQQNRNGGSGLGTLQSNARRAASNLKANANLVSKSLKSLLSDFFEMKAGNYNQTLNGAATARPSLNGTGFNPATAAETRPPRQPSEIWSPQSIERFLPR